MKTNTLVLIALAVLAVLLFVTKMVSFGDALTPPDKGNIIVYGSKTCPWCVKQEKYLIDNGLPYTFVDCKQDGPALTLCLVSRPSWSTTWSSRVILRSRRGPNKINHHGFP